MTTDVRRKYQNGKICIPSILLITLIIYGVVSQWTPVSANIMSIDTKPSITVGEDFSVTVMLQPTEPVKSYEFRFSYPSFVTLLNITNGDFFQGYQTFGSIGRRYDGIVTELYSLILGQGNITSSGSLRVFWFHADRPGQDDFRLWNAGITNETMYLPLSTLNASVVCMASQDDPDIPETQDHTRQIVGNILVIGFGIFLLIAAFKKFR
jgi:hypothetical protein